MNTTIEVKTRATTRAFAQSVRDELVAGKQILAKGEFEVKGSTIFVNLDGRPLGTVPKRLMKPEDIPSCDYQIQIESVDAQDLDNPTFKARLIIAQATSASAPVSYDSAKERIVGEGIASAQDVDAAIKGMEDNNIPASLINGILSTWKKGQIAYHPKVLYKNLRMPDEESYLTSMLIAAYSRHPILLVGPKSVGKNVAAATMASFCGLPYYEVGCGDGMEFGDIFGEQSTDNTAASSLGIDGARAYVRVSKNPDITDDDVWEQASQFELLKAKSASIQIVRQESLVIQWAKHGGVLMLNEMNMMDPNMLSFLVNPICSERMLLVPGEDAVELHSDCILIGSMNPPDYAGTRPLNEATASRFMILNFEYGKKIAPALQANFQEEIPEKALELCERFYANCFGMWQKGDIQDTVLNIRGYVGALKAYMTFPDVTTLDRQLQLYVINGADARDKKKILPLLDLAMN